MASLGAPLHIPTPRRRAQVGAARTEERDDDANVDPGRPGSLVVGYDGGGHELIPNGCVVFEDDRIVQVGRRFKGQVDRRIEATGKLVSPGFVNCHLHAATNAAQAVFLDRLKTDYFGSNLPTTRPPIHRGSV